MNYKLIQADLKVAAQFRGDLLVVLVDRRFAMQKSPGLSAVERFWKLASDSDAFTIEEPSQLTGFSVDGCQAPHLSLCSVGVNGKRDFRKAVGHAVLYAKKVKAQRIMVCLSALQTLSEAELGDAILAISDGVSVYTDTKPSAKASPLAEVVLSVAEISSMQKSFRQSMATVQGLQLAKKWANRPANHATPTLLAKAAQELAKHKNVTCKVLTQAQVARLKMGCFIGVAQGSKEPLKFIELQYRGAGAKQVPTVLIGKGITFDSGGISIKPAAEMDEMKFDMCGAASVLGVFGALAQLQPKINVVGLIPACENLPGPAALKPGDVLTAMDGQTVEVLNTDAEGRLILCDALVYAKRFKPKTVIDIATLTGACVVALGAVRSGLFSNDDQLADALMAAGESSKDKCWRMPLDDAYAMGLKSNFADVANVGGRAGGAITAAKFLQRFVGDFAWAHLDVAGTAWTSGANKGATGRPVPLLIDYLLQR